MSENGTVHECQFPNCQNLAAWYVKRGTRHFLHACDKHRAVFHDMPNREVDRLYESASGRRSYRVGPRFGMEAMT